MIRTLGDTLLSKVVSALSRAQWRLRSWSIHDTTMNDECGTGVRLTCPSDHPYWGRSLRQAEHELANEKKDCAHCERGRMLMTFS